MALTAPAKIDRRGNARGQSFVYPVAPGETIYTGSLCCVNAAGQLVRLQTAGGVAFVGMAMSGYSNVGNAAAGPGIACSNDEMALTVPAATFANINAPVYATDDATLSLAAPGSGFAGKVGVLIGIDNGQTYVKVQGN
jgi:hypothetical protein